MHVGMKMRRFELDFGSAELNSIKMSSIQKSTRVHHDKNFQFNFDSIKIRKQLSLTL